MKSNYKKKKSIKLFFNNIKNNSKIALLKSKLNEVGYDKYLPSFSKEWNNTAYFYNKNKLLNIPIVNPIINKIIKSYFNLYLNISNLSKFKSKFFLRKLKRKYLRRIRKSLKRIYLSNAEIKYTNNKAMITLYIIDKQKDVLKKRFLRSKKIMNKIMFNNFFFLYKSNIIRIYEKLKNIKTDYLYSINLINKKNYFRYKLKFLNKFIILKDLYIRKILILIIRKYWFSHLKRIKKYSSLYSLNRYKYDQSFLLPKLNNILSKITNKKIEYNIVNLKSITYNSDLITNILAFKLKKRKPKHIKNMLGILNKANLPKINIIKERSLLVKRQKSLDYILNKYRDLKIISNINNNSFDTLLSNIYFSTFNLTNRDKSKRIHSIIYNSIKYKNLGGIRLEVKGRLTKRYRADRSVYSFRAKGGLKNIDSSFRKLPSFLFRGNKNANVTHSIFKGKRRVGAFAVQGWIGGK